MQKIWSNYSLQGKIPVEISWLCDNMAVIYYDCERFQFRFEMSSELRIFITETTKDNLAKPVDSIFGGIVNIHEESRRGIRNACNLVKLLMV